MVDDGYVAWYQAKLWALLPAIYRSMDGGTAAVPGPLQELLNRVGAQTATLRRSIDRLWENQSIETCDDWVVPYIGDLLATRLVSCLDARAQRLDVAKTIYYRRRSGTLGVLEELAADIAGRDARAVEFFRRLGRTRHQFDPPIGNAFAAAAPAWAASTTYTPGQTVANGANAYQCATGGISAASGGPTGTGSSIADGSVVWSFADPVGSLVPAVIEGLAGANSRTPAGGFADLRAAYAAANTNGAFDEFAHTADLRRGAQSSGWYNISHLGVFIWWLQSFPVIAATPVSNGKSPPCYSFDPSGRQIQLFAPSSRTSASFGEDWVSPDEWQLPVAVREVLWNLYPDQLYPSAFWVGLGGGTAPAVQPRGTVSIHPDRGLFSFVAAPPAGEILTQYHFGFMSTIGAGGFAAASLEPIAQPAAVTTVSGGGGLATALGGITVDATVQITDSRTYPGPTTPVTLPDKTLVVTVTDKQRPVVRWKGGGATWTITGTGGSLVLQGMWLQGADIVLAGNFSSVSLRMVTLDPGSSDPAGALIGTAVDATPLAPVHLWVEASIGTLSLERCVTGPIRTRNAGAIEQLTATDSIIQAIPTPAGGDYALQTGIGTISLARCTVLGRAAVHRLEASECILDDVAIAEDTQHGCVRFTAYAQGSTLHAPYRSVVVPPAGPLFVSRRFGEAPYARLRRLADNAIIAPQTGDTILGGAQNGAEMGAFSGEGVTLKKRGLVIKFEEYAPLGVYPVWIDAD
ncbi:MAG: hypothetical protein ABSC95_06890 [Acetobacteraceae bacterium]